MEKSVFISVGRNGPNTSVHIRQFVVEVKRDAGMIKVNSDGLQLTTDEFASFMFQLTAIEQSFIGQIEVMQSLVPPTMQIPDMQIPDVQIPTMQIPTMQIPTVHTKDVQTDEHTHKRSRVGTKGELHERLQKANKMRKI